MSTAPTGAPDASASRMHIIVLNSGSNGNAVYVESAKSGAGVLLDCGISRKQIEVRLKVHGRFADRVRGVFITHEHGDHVRGLEVFNRMYHAPLHLTEETYRRLWSRAALKGFHFMRHHDKVAVEDITVQAVPKSHDAADPVSFLVTIDGVRFLYSTDHGELGDAITALLPSVDALMLESNYDVQMLWEGDYPADLKARVDSRVGHLSNDQAMSYVERHCDGKLRALILAHVSENNNTHELVREATDAMLTRASQLRPAVYIASRHTVGDLISV